VNIFESGFDVFISFIIFLTGWVIVLITANRISLKLNRATILYIWHSLFAILFILVIEQIGGDAKNYFNRARLDYFQLKLGTNTVIFLCYIFGVLLNLSYFATSLIFNIFGSLGMLFLDSSLQKTSRTQTSRFSQLFAKFAIFTPSISFWSSGIGKDSIVFLGISLAIWSMQAIKGRLVTLLLAIIIIFVIRPHIGIALLCALLASVLFYPKLSAGIKVFTALVASYALILIMPIALTYTGIGDKVSYSTVNSYIEERANKTLIGGNQVDLSNMNPAFRMANYGFRPTVFEARSPTQFFSAADNFVLSIIFILLCFSYAKTGNKNTENKNTENKNNSQMFLLLYFILCWTMLALTTSNLGIAQRQKWMFMPVMFILFLERQNKYKSNSDNKNLK